MHKLNRGLAALLCAIILPIGDVRADFLEAFAGAGTSEAGLVNSQTQNGLGASASAQYDSDPGLDFIIHSTSSASINNDGAGHPSFHLRAIADYSGPADLIGSAARSSIALSDTLTALLPFAGTQVFGHVQIGVEGSLNSNGGGSNLGRLSMSGSHESFDLDILTTSHTGAFSQVVNGLLEFTGSSGVYSATFTLFASARASSSTSGITTVDFGNTIKILGITYTDVDGNVLEGSTQSGLGLNYQAGTPVPVPGALVLLSSGLPGMLGCIAMVKRGRSRAKKVSDTAAS